jgi:alpha,alpha-trehalase
MIHRLLGSGFTLAVPFLASLFFSSVTTVSGQTRDAQAADPPGLEPILGYIARGWDALTRSLDSCADLRDPKAKGQAVLYLPLDYDEPVAVRKLAQDCGETPLRLPAVIHRPGELAAHEVDPPGLLYMERPYVVPGGRFNEMYGWDSYFIIRGLLEAGRAPLAKGMVDNFFFEIEHYGAVLNANRTYYLSRSQPPFLSSMILAVYNAEKAAGQDDHDEWLARGYGYAQRDYRMWTQAPHLAGTTGLSRYYGLGTGPSPEELHDDPDYYRTVAAYFEKDPKLSREYLVHPDHGAPTMPAVLRHFTGDAADPSAGSTDAEVEREKNLVLTEDFYSGDRAMRESGFDISFRFGPYGAATHHYAPVCLNGLLYRDEKNLEEMARVLGREDEAKAWAARAEARRAAVVKYLWDPKRGMFFDYDFVRGQRSTYDYVATFYPLWAGLATPEQARAVEKNLKLFERPGGVMTSTTTSGVQWDAPYAWAPLQLLAVEGLRNYGFSEDANRISYEFLSMVRDEFKRDGTIREKYDATTRSARVHVEAGYDVNVIGFGWTNGVFLALLHALPAEWRARLAN